MFSWCARQYAKRLVNVNVNIMLAGFFAIVLTTLVLKLLNAWHLLDNQPKLVIVGLTFALDLIFDLVIAVGLHWLASHVPDRLRAARRVVDAADRVIDAAPPSISFVKDTTTIQFQRLCLSPVFYGTAWGVQWWLLHEGVRAEWTALPAYITAVVLTRVLHTPWLLYSDRKVWEQWEAATKARGSNNLAVVPNLRDLRQTAHLSTRNGALEPTSFNAASQARDRVAAASSEPPPAVPPHAASPRGDKPHSEPINKPPSGQGA
jgi:hypothetical protein